MSPPSSSETDGWKYEEMNGVDRYEDEWTDRWINGQGMKPNQSKAQEKK
jgi:hypothetical protein